MAKKLVDIFQVERKAIKESSLNDYEIFQDKQLLDDLRKKIISNLIDLKIPENKSMKDIINEEIDRELEGYDVTNLERNHIFNLIDGEVNGYGPILPLLEDESVADIMVNGPNDIFVEIDGKIRKDDSISFINDDHIIRTIDRLISAVGKTIDIKNPIVDSRLEDGSRIHAVIPPLAMNGPVFTIKKIRKEPLLLDDLIRIGCMTPYMADFLSSSIRARLNIIVCGIGGSGTTTILNALSNYIDDKERIITIENIAELNIHKPHVISFESNKKHSAPNTIKLLFNNAIKMRADRIVVGDIEEEEVYPVLQAINTGIQGLIGGLNASDPLDALRRLENLCMLTNPELTPEGIRLLISEGIDLIVCVEKLNDGKRKITHISEIVKEDKNLGINEIFRFHKEFFMEDFVSGEFVLYNTVLPKTFFKIKSRGISEIDFMFQK